MRENNIKIIFCDIDNTLTDFNGNILKKTSDYFKQINLKYKIILVTGRTNIYAIKKSIEANASNIVISDNGAIVYDYNSKKILCGNFLSERDIKLIWEISQKYNMICELNSITKRYCDRKHFSEEYINENYIAINNVNEIEEPISQIVLLNNNDIIYNKVINELLSIDSLQISNKGKENDGSNFIDINVKGSTKGCAIRKLYDILGINVNDSIAFGDSDNDLSMFENSGIKVAMINAKKEFKEKADYITEYSNNENGVAYFIEKNLVKENKYDE